MIRIISTPDLPIKNAWSAFITGHPHGNPFQSCEIVDFYKKIPGYSPVSIIAVDESSAVKGILVAVIQQEKGFITGRLSSRTIVYGGPLSANNDPAVAAILIRALVDKVKPKSIYIEFRNLTDTSAIKDAFSQNRFHYREHLNIVVPLVSLETNRSQLSKSKLRQIQSTLKTGAEIKTADSAKQISAFYKILQKRYKQKIKKPLPSLEFFLEFFRAKDLGTVLILEKDKKVIAGMVCPVYKDTLYEWYVCGLDGKEKNVYPSAMITWAAIEYGINNGLKYFDFMGAGSPDAGYGVREFKLKFGGELVNYGRYIRINNRFLYAAGKSGLFLFVKLNFFI